MLWFPHAKINLGLAVLEKRPDQYHSIESLLCPVKLFDFLEIVESKEDKLNLSGLSLPGNIKNNLVWKALLLMRKHFEFPPVKIHLHKQIPVGAGLGGGSSDAAFTLSGINQLFQLDISKTKLMELASVLGSDCPFFMQQKSQYAKGRGELMEAFPLNLKKMELLLVIPDFSVSTKEAYSKIAAHWPAILPKQALEMPVENWKSFLRNDFETIVFEEFPVLAVLKQKLYQEGAIYAALSGSGSALYALFSEKTEMELPVNYTYFWMEFPA